MKPVTTCLRLSSVLAATVGVSWLVGCGVGQQAGPVDALTPAITGAVHGGQNPVAFGHVALFATTSAAPAGSAAPGTMYGGSLTPIATTTADSNGNFAFTSGYACPAGQFAYIVSTGGNPGLAAGTDNSAIFMVAALGPCSGLGSVGVVLVNEVTTVAAAYALSGFAPVGGAGMTEAAVETGGAMAGITTSSTNVQGLTDGFANAANIVSVNTGVAYATTPTGGTVTQSIIHALADILQNCSNSLSASSSVCTSLFTDAQPPVATGIARPVNIWQAALDIAQYPGNNVGTLYGLLSAQAAFPESLTGAPNDWTVGVTYTSGLMSTESGMGLDGQDNVYAIGGATADLLKFSAQGAGGNANLLTTAGSTYREMTVDPSGNIWLSNGKQNYIEEYTGSSTLTNSAAYASSNANNYAIAADRYGDIWTVSYKKSTCSGTTGGSACTLYEYWDNSGVYTPVYQFAETGTPATTVDVKSPTDAGGARGLAVDSKTGNVWLTDIVSGDLFLFPTTLVQGGPATSTLATAPTPIALGTPASSDTTNNYGSVSVAVDASSNAWVVVTGGPATSGSTATAAVPGALYKVNSAGVVQNSGSGLTDGGALTTPGFLTIDGNGNIFIANTGASSTLSTIVEYSPSYNANAGGFLSPNLGFAPGATYANGTITGSTIYQAANVAVDRSGALWTMSTGSGTGSSLANVVQILGVAAPTDPVLADGNYGVKP